MHTCKSMRNNYKFSMNKSLRMTDQKVNSLSRYTEFKKEAGSSALLFCTTEVRSGAVIWIWGQDIRGI